MTSYKFERKERRKPSEDEFAKARKHEHELYVRDNDSQFWLCLCFRDQADYSRFLAEFGLPRRRYLSCEEFLPAVERVRPERVLKTFPHEPMSPDPVPNPLEGVEYTGDLQADCLAEAHAILAALQAAKAPVPLHEVTDSDVWTVVLFHDRAEVTRFLTEFNFEKYGDKYCDASRWMADVL